MEANGSHEKLAEKSFSNQPFEHEMKIQARKGLLSGKKCRKVLVQADHPCRVGFFLIQDVVFPENFRYPKFDGVSSLSSLQTTIWKAMYTPFSDKQMKHHIPISRFVSWKK
jgi:hypothetical protein